MTAAFSTTLILRERARQTPEVTAVRIRERGIWLPVTWAEYADSVARVVSVLDSRGVGPGDRVLLHLSRSQRWAAYVLAADAVGATVTTVPSEAGTDRLTEHLSRPGVVMALTDDQATSQRVHAASERIGWQGWVHQVDHGGPATGAGRDDVRLSRAGGDAGAQLSPGHELGGVIAASARPQPGDELLSCGDPDDPVQRAVALTMAVRHGLVVNFGTDGSRLADELPQVEPTLLVAPDRTWTSLHRRFETDLAGARGLRALLLDRGLESSSRHWSLLVREPLCRRIGLRRTRSRICVGTPPVEVGEFFASIGRPLEVLDADPGAAITTTGHEEVTV